jgi:glycosyltransferase involved in cell wall biosynthesis
MTDTYPLISVILLCYNHEKFVAEALRGVLAQTYAPLDIVVVDDCSTDKTAEIVDEVLSNHPDRPVGRWIRNPQNLTWWGACPVGLAAARGDFVVLSCGDDIMLPDMVAEMADVWRQQNVSLVTTNVDYIDENSNPMGRTARDCNIEADDSFETLARDGANACCFGAAIGFERDVYSTFGLPPAYLGAIDIMLPFYAYLLKGARFVRKPLLKYRVHAQNGSMSLAAEKTDGVDKLRIHERIFNSHLAHAVLMLEELDRLASTMPARYAQLADKIDPLLNIQTVEIAKKLVKTQIELQKSDEGRTRRT